MKYKIIHSIAGADCELRPGQIVDASDIPGDAAAYVEAGVIQPIGGTGTATKTPKRRAVKTPANKRSK